MTTPSPIEPLLAESGAVLTQFGPEELSCRIAEVLGSLELEYAALRSSCVLIDRPDRSIIHVSGEDASAFLNNMLTQELGKLEAGMCVRSFWLSRQGRVQSDIVVRRRADGFDLETDLIAVAPTVESLGGYVITEDVVIEDMTDRHVLQLSGPTSLVLFKMVSNDNNEPATGTNTAVSIAGVSCFVRRDDDLGVPTLWIDCDAVDSSTVYGALMAAGHDPNSARIGEQDAALNRTDNEASRIRLVPAGWHAFNIARIESGLPLFSLDFGPSSLPGETGLLDERVSFTKGCYLGQEIVARMHSLGHPKRILVALSIQADSDETPLPETGFGINKDGTSVGAITSATVSPMLGGAPIALATLKWGAHEAGTELEIDAPGASVTGTVRETLRFV